MQLDEAQLHGRGANNFDLIRLFAALLVLFAHSFNVVGIAGPGLENKINEIGYGDLGVAIFFATSGFLIARSFAVDPRQFTFWTKRALRIMPALVISVLLTALVLGPIVTTVPLHTYLLAPETKYFIVGNITFQLQTGLPGVFDHNFVTHTANSSLWTLPLEIKAYALIAFLGLAPRRWFRYALPAAGLYFALLLVPDIRNALPLGNRLIAAMPNIQASHAATVLAGRGQLDTLSRPFACFAVGAALFALGRWIPLRWWIAGLLSLLWIPGLIVGGATLSAVAGWTIPYLVLVLAYLTYERVHLPESMGDYSYGIYIFAFPIQQAMVQWFRPTSGWVVLALSAPVTIGLAVLSWRFIEAPALTVKARLAPALGPVTDGAERDPATRAELDGPIALHTPIETLIEPPDPVTADA